MAELKPIIEQSMIQYSGAVLQSRALMDVRDCLKPSARQIFYSMLIHKLTYNKPYKKTANAVGMAMADFYIHGDASCAGIIMRAGQDFSLRYPLIDVKGNAGTLIASGNWAATRYTESRLSKIMTDMFNDIDKNVIIDWRDSYDNTKQFPSILPSKGFYNIVNGGSGIGVGMAASIPQFNLKEVNEALIKLLWDPDINDDEIICMPDFSTGGILLNASQVRESLKRGTGYSCKLRAVIDYDNAEKTLIVTEIPYGVYTNTICKELDNCLEMEDNPGIIRYNDLTGRKPLIKIYLTKNARPEKVIRYLYKNTSLQNYFGINMTMLENGRFPRVFGWKESLQSYLDHQKIVYRRGFEFDLQKIESRLHIIKGLLIALANIDEVVKVIKTSSSSGAAAIELTKRFDLSDEQAKAILDMKLSRLAHLEIAKLEKEKQEKEKERDHIKAILDNRALLYKEIEKDLQETINKYWDPRRTQILNIETEESEPIEKFNIQLSLTNKNNIFATRTSSLYTQRRGGIGNKLKLDANEVVIETESIESTDKILFFTKKGQFYHCSASEVQIDEKIAIESLIPITDDEVKALAAINEKEKYPYVFFITKNGLIKKSAFSEYNTKRKIGVKALNLDNNDEIIEVLFGENEKIGVLTHNGNLLMFDSKTINSIGRLSRGVTAIKLNNSDYVVSAKIIPNNTQFICSVTEKGLIKQTPIAEFSIQNRATKGSRIQKIDNDYLADFIPLIDEGTIIVAATASCIRMKTNEIPTHSRDTIGAKAIKLRETDKVIQLTKE